MIDPEAQLPPDVPEDVAFLLGWLTGLLVREGASLAPAPDIAGVTVSGIPGGITFRHDLVITVGHA